MAFNFAPSKDWVKKINDFMQDYNTFSNGYTDVDSGGQDIRRWGQKTYDQNTIIALNGCSIAEAGNQQYTWNTQGVSFLHFNINLGSNSIGTNTSLDVIKLPYGGLLSVSDLRGGSVDDIAVTDFVQGNMIFV